MPEVIGLQYLNLYGINYFLAPKERIETNTMCVVEGEHGLQMARVVRSRLTIPESCLTKNMRPILRVATGRDHEQYKKNNKREKEAYALCRQKVKEKGLQMKLVGVSYSLDGRKAVFFFTAANRVDFRELVKDLAQALKLKIEMRQIGVRDEARRLGGVGCCGRPLCCASFLKDFSSVSIRMAKEQNVSLNPTKVSGLCGRLMCCLAYEYEGMGTKGKKKRDEQISPEELNIPSPAMENREAEKSSAPADKDDQQQTTAKSNKERYYDTRNPEAQKNLRTTANNKITPGQAQPRSDRRYGHFNHMHKNPHQQ